MNRIYYHFPSNIDFERSYGYNADMRYLMKVMASIHGKSGSVEFDTRGLDVKQHVENVRARRDVTVDVAHRRVDFMPLTPQNLTGVLQGLEPSGTADFRVTVGYTYVDKNFNRLPLESDVFLVRATVDGSLTLQVACIKGQGRTLPEEVANTIETQLKIFKG
ncbi:MAG: hypothetical protein A4E28_00994 [Methanocella sp. PtaU1.Bin125]|nr:MAG: hypothetical protein A4E28_00994 [Methanocella sp. PtaU1.Bin125]